MCVCACVHVLALLASLHDVMGGMGGRMDVAARDGADGMGGMGGRMENMVDGYIRWYIVKDAMSRKDNEHRRLSAYDNQ